MKHGARRDPSHRLEIMSGFMSGEVARSLELLRVIDGTVEALVYTRRNMEALSEACDSLILRATTENLEGEPLDEVLPSLIEARSYSVAAHDIMLFKWRSAQESPELEPDDCVADAYEQVIVAIDGLTSRMDRLMVEVNLHISQSQMTPLERKQARKRPAFLLSQGALNAIAKSGAEHLADLGKKNRVR